MERGQYLAGGYIPVSQLDLYLQGRLNPLAAVETLKTLGSFAVRTMAASRSEEKLESGETLPYSVGVYRFAKGNGLYTLVGFDTAQTQEQFEHLLDSLSYSGLGGKRSAGLGRFSVTKSALPESLEKRLQGSKTPCISLSVCMALWLCGFSGLCAGTAAETRLLCVLRRVLLCAAFSWQCV